MYSLRRTILVSVMASACWAVQALAHDAGLSVAELRLHENALELTVSFALADVQRMLPPSVHLGTDSSQSTIDGSRAALDELASLLWDARAGGQALIPAEIHVEFTPSDNLAFRSVYLRPQTGLLVFRATNLGSLPSTHRELFTVRDEHGRSRAEYTLTSRESSATVSLEENASGHADPSEKEGEISDRMGRNSFREFFKLGVEHIWTGYDHLLFLFALLLVCRSWRSILTIVTCFTLAHSLTLSLAALNIVNLSAAIVEPAIAASIVFVAAENLWLRGKDARHRGWLTFAFGLVHGFGFASVLRDLGVGAHGEGIAWPLFSFNLGVEAGQICVAAVVLPALTFFLRDEKARRFAVPAASTVVAAAGLYWLAERTILA